MAKRIAGRKLSYKLPPLLEEHLKKYGWDIRTLARVANVKEQRLYDNIKGVYPMSLGTALSVIKALQLDDQENEAIRLLRQIQKQNDDHKKSVANQSEQ